MVADDRSRPERVGPQSWDQARQQAWGGGSLQDSGSFLNFGEQDGSYTNH